MNVQQLLDLLGSVVSFEYHTISGEIDHSCEVKGLVIGVSIELNNRHALSIMNYEDTEETYQISRMKKFKATALDPYALFENIKNGSISVDI